MISVYVIYNRDDSLNIRSIHEDSGKAIAALRDEGYGKIAKIRIGEDVEEAIAKWEGTSE